jgi:hypothetical protein
MLLDRSMASAAALIAVFLACFRTYKLSPGERGILMVLANDKEQARVIFNYCRAFVEGVPMLAESLVRETASYAMRSGFGEATRPPIPILKS